MVEYFPLIAAAIGVIASYAVAQYKVAELTKRVESLSAILDGHNNTITRLTVLEVLFANVERQQREIQQSLQELLISVNSLRIRGE